MFNKWTVERLRDQLNHVLVEFHNGSYKKHDKAFNAEVNQHKWEKLSYTRGYYDGGVALATAISAFLDSVPNSHEAEDFKTVE